MKHTVLFTEKNSIYNQLGHDCYDALRNAYTFNGFAPVLSHPPCRLWSSLKKLSNAPACEKLTALFAVIVTRQNGGVLEHPFGSDLFKNRILPQPGRIDAYGGYTILVDQFWWGHKCRKKTFLYIVGCSINELPIMPLRFDAVEYCIDTRKRKNRVLKFIKKSERSTTPLAFAQWLCEINTIIKKNKLNTLNKI